MEMFLAPPNLQQLWKLKSHENNQIFEKVYIKIFERFLSR